MQKVLNIWCFFVFSMVLLWVQSGCGYNLSGPWTGYFGKDNPKAGIIKLEIQKQNSGGLVEGSIELTNVGSCNGGQSLSKTLLESGSLVTEQGAVTLLTRIGNCRYSFKGEIKNGLILGSYTVESTVLGITFKDSGSFNLERP
jgi:hypothetical protein